MRAYWDLQIVLEPPDHLPMQDAYCFSARSVAFGVTSEVEVPMSQLHLLAPNAQQFRGFMHATVQALVEACAKECRLAVLNVGYPFEWPDIVDGGFGITVRPSPRFESVLMKGLLR